MTSRGSESVSSDHHDWENQRLPGETLPIFLGMFSLLQKYDKVCKNREAREKSYGNH